MTEYVDLVISPENRLPVLRVLDNWEDEQEERYVHTVGNESAAVVIYDFLVGALSRLKEHRIPFETRPCDPKRPPPVRLPL